MLQFCYIFVSSAIKYVIKCRDHFFLLLTQPIQLLLGYCLGILQACIEGITKLIVEFLNFLINICYFTWNLFDDLLVNFFSLLALAARSLDDFLLIGRILREQRRISWWVCCDSINSCCRLSLAIAFFDFEIFKNLGIWTG